MKLEKLLPVWYGGGIGNNCNTSVSVGHLSCAGFYIPKLQNYEHKHFHKRNRNKTK
ncbi:hypothetical protein EV144_104340 [Flavobacterium sp. 270]|nr:hypothetical protein EV144_104340 [Flavobacterium sp. 270]